MTPKELLYIEDALGHEKQMQTSCNDFSAQIQDTELSNFVTSLANRHSQTFGSFFSLLNG